jgi:trehalose 6-phosphate synthase
MPGGKNSVGSSPQPECIIVSNRGPIEHAFAPDGEYEIRDGAGGVVTGLLGAIQRRPIVWVALAMTDADREITRLAGKRPVKMPALLENIELHLITIPQKMYTRYYDQISNHLLWFIQHYLFLPTRGTVFSHRTSLAWEKGYCAVNEAVARAVIEIVKTYGTEVPIIFQDYHFYLAAELVRASLPEARLSQVIYIPWPDARYWAMLPEYMVQAIYQSMAANDIVGFQTLNDARNFLAGAERFLAGAQVSWDTPHPPGFFYWQKRRIVPHISPIPLAPEYIHTLVQSDEARLAIEALSHQVILNSSQRIILREDRVEPAKNIIQGFQAYTQMLRKHPELLGQVTFLALFVPSRQSLSEYRSYEKHVKSTIEHINARYGIDHWQPIVAIFGNNRVRGLVALQYYDVLLVNSIMDGLNLVVKEGALVNARSGVIILSRTTGAHDTLGQHTLSIAPTDIEATAEALYQALTMPLEERTMRAEHIRALMHSEDAGKWLDRQLRELREETSSPF